MTIYCIKTADIPAEELPKWIALSNQVEGITDVSDTWSAYLLKYPYVYVDTTYLPVLVGSPKPPKNSQVLTLTLYKTLAFLKLTGDCNDPNNTLQILTSTED